MTRLDLLAAVASRADAGYGFSVLDEPMPKEEFDLESTRKMFADWGWNGEVSRKPPWIQ